MTRLLICEKPQQAMKIAEALSDGKYTKKLNKKIPYYELTRNNKKVIITCAVGHLYNLKETDGTIGWNYPFFTYEWRPVFEINKHAGYTKPYLETIKKVSKDISDIYVSTDFDEEGSLLGERIVTLLLQKKDARRMKFSSLTKNELVDAYEKAMPHLDWPQVMAGMARHELDFLWGLNCSRALTLALKSKMGGFNILSTGRVQGPTLAILTKLDKKIDSFKPKDYWEVYLESKLGKTPIKAAHEKNKFWEKKEAQNILKKTKAKKASIKEVDTKRHKQLPPFPFDLTTLQTEAYRIFKISPKQTLSLTQSLYTHGLITYPRTSSQQIPPSINIREIITKLSKQSSYKELCSDLLKKKQLVPNNGKKKDPAHPACIATGEAPKKLTGQELKLYDLIARRTLACLGEPAEREFQKIMIDCNKEVFILEGARTIYPGWHKLYHYVDLREMEFPIINKGDEVKNPKTSSEQKQTKPPRRYTPASLVRKLEKMGLGTKTTRAMIIDILYERNYVEGKEIKTTDLGKAVTDTLEKHVPELVSPELTREFEKDMNEIVEGEHKKEEILEKAVKVLDKLLKKFKKDEKEIGGELEDAFKQTREEQTFVGKCDKCGKGEMKLMYSRKNHSYFIACDQYPKCKHTMSLPMGLPKTTDKTCERCKSPLVLMIRKGKRPFLYCINKECPAKKEWMEKHGMIK
ncbi:MAG: DNA topoisomerase I [Nanoarchaeota archaeon]|nr:DNA topoisomerase I [Nanoarchaeota archaeon]